MAEKRQLSIAILQTHLYRNDEKRAISDAVSLARAAKKKSARLLCLPEHWLLDKLITKDSDLYRVFGALAAELDVYISLGGIFESTSEKPSKENTHFLSPTISPDGKIISKQEKVHLFRRETTLAVPGESFEPFEIDGVRIGVMVCHDVVFPESARTLVLRGAELLLNPSLIPRQGIGPWKTYLSARSLENRVPIVAPNPSLPPRVPGNSVLLDLKYEKAQGIMQVKENELGSAKGILVSKIKFEDEISALREERLSERRPGAYVQFNEPILVEKA